MFVPRQFSCSILERDSRCPEFRFFFLCYAVPHDILTWCRKRGKGCFRFTLSSLFFVTPIHSASELLATPFNRLEIVILLCPPSFSAPSSFPIIYPFQFALFSLLLRGLLTVTIHIPPSSPHFSVHFVVCFVTGSWPFPKRVLQWERSSAFSLKFQYLLFSLKSSVSCLFLLPHLLAHCIFLQYRVVEGSY